MKKIYSPAVIAVTAVAGQDIICNSNISDPTGQYPGGWLPGMSEMPGPN